MATRLAYFEAKPEHADHVRQALSDMVQQAPREDPTLGEYVLYQADDPPNGFVIEQHVNAVETNLGDDKQERLMELGTVLREELNGPIRMYSYQEVARSA